MTGEATVMMMAMVLGQSIRIVIWIFSPSYFFQIGRMLCYQTLLRSDPASLFLISALVSGSAFEIY